MNINWYAFDNVKKLYIKIKKPEETIYCEGTLRQIVAYLYDMVLRFGDHIPDNLKDILEYDGECRKWLEKDKNASVYVESNKDEYDAAFSKVKDKYSKRRWTKGKGKYNETWADMLRKRVGYVKVKNT